MAKDTVSTRRSFLKGGALAAAPLASAAPVAAKEVDALRMRAARLEDEAAIRDLHERWLRQINAGADAAELLAEPRACKLGEEVCAIAADLSADAGLIEIAPEGGRARGRFHCAVETRREIARVGTFAQMAHAQGGGFVRQTQRRVLEADYVKRDAGWAIAAVRLAEA